MLSAQSSHPSRSFTLGQKVSAFFQHGVHILIERRQRLILGLGLPNRLLSMLVDGSRDLLPLRHLRQRLYSLQLIAECIRVLVVCECRVVPRSLPRGKIAREYVKL